MKANRQLYEDINHKLRFDPSVTDSDKIAVSVHEGIVTLGGVVTSYSQKIAAERATKSISGVKGIVNEIKVETPPQYLRDDVTIAKAAVNALAWNVDVPHESIQVAVEDSWIKLTGEVRWFYQKKAAEHCVRHLYGIKGVINSIEVKPTITPIEIKHSIIEEFKRNALIDAEQIEVEAENGTAILRGTVRNWAAMQEAVEAAWSVPGISYVENRLSISG